MAGMLPFDAASARRVARTYATPDVVGQRARTLALLAVRPGERVLDVGAGPGQLLEAIAGTAGPDGVAHGIDPNPSMVQMARRRCGYRAHSALALRYALLPDYLLRAPPVRSVTRPGTVHTAP